MLHLRPADYRTMPWKNGGGSTTEIAIEPPGASLEASFAWRISSVSVAASGPFSPFPGMARALLLVEGVGFILDIEGQGRQRLKHPGQVVAFSGDATVGATLIQGPCVDFGIISDPTKVKISLQWLNLGREATLLEPAPTTLLYAPWGPVWVDPLDLELDSRDCLRLDPADAAPALRLRAAFGTTPAVVVSIWPVS
jgi:environmental stress-induced protein Ves